MRSLHDRDLGSDSAKEAMCKPKVSVVITCYNDKKWVISAIRSVLEQTYEDYEVIAVDDASNDGTKEVLRRYEKEGILKLFVHRRNKGVSAARNTGIKNANGCLIAFLDADDEWRKNKLKAQVRSIKSVDGAGAVYSGFIKINEEGKPFEKVKPSVHKPEKYLENLFVKGAGIIPSSILIRSECFRKVGMFDEDLESMEDIDMWMRISGEFKMYYIDRELVRKRDVEKSLGTNRPINIEGAKRISEKIIARYPRLRELKNKRRAKIYHSAASYFLKKGNMHNGKRYALQSIKYDKMVVKPYFTLLLSLFPAGVARQVAFSLSRLSRGVRFAKTTCKSAMARIKSHLSKLI